MKMRLVGLLTVLISIALSAAYARDVPGTPVSTIVGGGAGDAVSGTCAPAVAVQNCLLSIPISLTEPWTVDFTCSGPPIYQEQCRNTNIANTMVCVADDGFIQQLNQTVITPNGVCAGTPKGGAASNIVASGYAP